MRSRAIFGVSPTDARLLSSGGERPALRELARAFRPGSRGGAWPRWALAMVAGAAVAAATGALVDGTPGVVAWQVGLLLAPLATAAACMGALRGAAPAGRATWQLLAIGCLLAAMSQVVYARLEILGLRAPFPSMGFHLLVAFHLALAEGAVLALRPAHEPRPAVEIALDGALILLASSAWVLRFALDQPLAAGLIEPAQVVAVLVGQLAVSASVLFATLLVVWRDTSLSGPAVDSLLVAAVFFAFGHALLALGLEVTTQTEALGSGAVRLAGWLALAASATLATVRPEGPASSGRRERVARRTRQIIIPAVPLFMAWWALDAARSGAVSDASLVVISLMAILLAARIGAALYAVEQEISERQGAEHRAALARLRAVTAQMNPHFLFNALHSLSALVRRDVAATEGALQRLGGLLGYGLDSGDEMVSLREEWDFARDYLELEKLRLGPRLAVTTSIPPELLSSAVPPFVLQPLVENAVKHAVSPLPEGGTVHVSARAEAGRLVLGVRDSGPGADESVLTEAAGVGLRAVRAQLERHVPSEWTLSGRRLPEGGFAVEVSLPIDVD